MLILLIKKLELHKGLYTQTVRKVKMTEKWSNLKNIHYLIFFS